MTGMRCLAPIAAMASMSHTFPPRCTGIIARVPGVMAASIFVASIWNVAGSVSTKIGRAWERRTVLMVAMKVYGGTITSSPGSTPRTFKEMKSAAVPLQVASDCFAPVREANASSNFFTYWPLPRNQWPLRRTSRRAFSSVRSNFGQESKGLVRALGPPRSAGFGGVAAPRAVLACRKTPAAGSAATKRRRFKWFNMVSPDRLAWVLAKPPQTNPATTAKSTYEIDSVSRACQLLNCFRHREEVLRLRDIVARTGLNTATAFRILRTFERHGLVERLGRSGYRSAVRAAKTARYRFGYASQGGRFDIRPGVDREHHSGGPPGERRTALLRQRLRSRENAAECGPDDS